MNETVQSENIGALALALSKAQGELNGADKTSQNPFFKSNYADLYQCIEAAKEALRKNELCVIQTTRDSDKGVTIITTLAHSSGEWIRGFLTMNPKKDDDQSRGSSITYGRRYAFAAIVGLAQKDDDGNASSNKNTDQKEIHDKPVNKPRDEKKDNRATVDRWLGYIDKFTDKSFDEFQVACDQYIDPAIKNMANKGHANEMTIAKNEMIKHLQEERV